MTKTKVFPAVERHLELLYYLDEAKVQLTENPLDLRNIIGSNLFVEPVKELSWLLHH